MIESTQIPFPIIKDDPNESPVFVPVKFELKVNKGAIGARVYNKPYSLYINDTQVNPPDIELSSYTKVFGITYRNRMWYQVNCCTKGSYSANYVVLLDKNYDVVRGEWGNTVIKLDNNVIGDAFTRELLRVDGTAYYKLEEGEYIYGCIPEIDLRITIKSNHNSKDYKFFKGYELVSSVSQVKPDGVHQINKNDLLSYYNRAQLINKQETLIKLPRYAPNNYSDKSPEIIVDMMTGKQIPVVGNYVWCNKSKHLIVYNANTVTVYDNKLNETDKLEGVSFKYVYTQGNSNGGILAFYRTQEDSKQVNWLKERLAIVEIVGGKTKRKTDYVYVTNGSYRYLFPSNEQEAKCVLLGRVWRGLNDTKWAIYNSDTLELITEELDEEFTYWNSYYNLILASRTRGSMNEKQKHGIKIYKRESETIFAYNKEQFSIFYIEPPVQLEELIYDNTIFTVVYKQGEQAIRCKMQRGLILSQEEPRQWVQDDNLKHYCLNSLINL